MKTFLGSSRYRASTSPYLSSLHHHTNPTTSARFQFPYQASYVEEMPSHVRLHCRDFTSIFAGLCFPLLFAS